MVKMKRVLLVALAVIMLVAIIPETVLAASPEQQFKALKASNLPTYDTPLPTNGVAKTEQQINAEIKKIKAAKIPGKGKTIYSSSLYFSKENGVYAYAEKSKSWFNINKKTKFSSWRAESTVLLPPDQAATYCQLSKEDKKYFHNYFWKKGAKKGSYSKYKKTKGGGSSDPSITITYSDFQQYKDETVLGQKCLVYSYVITVIYGPDPGDSYSYTSYIWRSRKNSWEIKSVNVNLWTDTYYDWETDQDITVTYEYSYTNILFTLKKVSKKASFFKKPTGVKFVSGGASSAKNDNPFADNYKLSLFDKAASGF